MAKNTKRSSFIGIDTFAALGLRRRPTVPSAVAGHLASRQGMDDNYWVEDTSLVTPSPCKKRKPRAGKRKFEFVGWGSRPLIEFLESIGKDPAEEPTQRQVAGYITKYVNEKGLASAEKKRKILCDDRLHALFGKKSLSRTKVYEMLEVHFAENQDDSDDELSSSDDEGCTGNTSLSLQRNHTSVNKKVKKAPVSCFAAVTSGNIKLIYLKRSLIQELLKTGDSFELKMVGSFVRMKSDPNDIYQKNRFQLHQVTGVEKVPGAGNDGFEFLLRLSNFFKEVPISMLSDDNFSEEEVEDVRDRIKSGLLKRLNLKAVEEKTRILHADITNHWIPRELTLLQHKIDHANEKGWRREYTMFDYLERKEMLKSSSECEKLLLNIPEVIAEKLEPEEMLQTPSECENPLLDIPQVIADKLDPEVTAVTPISEKEEGSGDSPKSILRAGSDVSSTEVLAGGIVAPSQVIPSDSHAAEPPSETIDATLPISGEKPGENQQLPPVADEGIKSTEVVASEGNDEPAQKPVQEQASAAVVVDLLSDDEPEEEVPMVNGQSSGGEFPPEDDQWYYLDPRGQTHGPFSVFMLKMWNDASYFYPGFRVWKTTQTSSEGEGVLLTDLLSQTFS